jgi:hypothetical protein
MLGDWAARLVSNGRYKLLSVLLALAAWLYVQGDQVHETKVKARVAWTLPPDLTATEPLPPTVTVLVRGTRAGVRSSAVSALILPADLTGYGAGEHVLELEGLGVRGLPAGVEVLSVLPGAMRFELDEVATRKVELRPQLVGDPAPGFQVESVTLDPPVVEAAGPRVVLSDLPYLRTKPIDVSGLAADAFREVSVDPPRGIEVRTAAPTRAAVQITPVLEQRQLQGVPVYVWRHPDWVPEVAMIDVRVQGPSASLRQLTSDSVAAFVHLPDKPTRASYDAPHGPTEGLRLRLLHPGGDEVEVLAVDPPQVRVVQR